MKGRLLVIGTLASVLFISCSKDSLTSEAEAKANSETVTENSGEKRTAYSNSTSWKITSLTVNDADLTRNFNGVILQLFDDNNAYAVTSSGKVPGRWEVVNDQYIFQFDTSGFGSATDVASTDMSFINELNGTWDIRKKYYTGIVLEINEAKNVKQLILDVI